MAPSHNRIQSAPMRRRPMSPLVPLAAVIALIIGGLFFLAHYAGEQPMKQIEVDVPHDQPAR